MRLWPLTPSLRLACALLALPAVGLLAHANADELNSGFSGGMSGDLVCAAVVPCDADGQLLPEFDGPGGCASQYRAVCARMQSDLVLNELAECRNQQAFLTRRLNRAVRRVRTLRRMVRARR